jgi:hypothetical protein
LEIVLLATEGRGGEAQVSVNGERLAVVDGLSPGDAPTSPGPLSSARLEVVTIPHLSASAREDDDPSCRLRREHGWRYRARARVLSSEPLRVDLGAFTVELALELRGGIAAGDLLDLAIDRIILSAG